MSCCEGRWKGVRRRGRGRFGDGEGEEGVKDRREVISEGYRSVMDESKTMSRKERREDGGCEGCGEGEAAERLQDGEE